MSLTFGVDRVCKHGVVGPCDQCNPFGVTEAHARNTDPQTSHDAAKGIEPTNGQRLILELLREQGPMTDEWIYRHPQIARAMSPSGARSRRAELVAKGLVEAVGTEVISTGNKATVWALTRSVQ